MKPKNKSILEDVPEKLPTLARAQKLQERAASVGFEWPSIDHAWEKLAEELAELREAFACGTPAEQMDELGDVLFVVVNLGRMMGLDVETALQRGSEKFTRRFQGMEQEVHDRNQVLTGISLAEMEQGWQRQKQKERGV